MALYHLYLIDCRHIKKAENLTYCQECWAGYYCPTDATVEPSPCAKGDFSDVGAIQCTICEAGYYCDTNATTYDLSLLFAYCSL